MAVSDMWCLIRYLIHQMKKVSSFLMPKLYLKFCRRNRCGCHNTFRRSQNQNYVGRCLKSRSRWQIENCSSKCLYCSRDQRVIILFLERSKFESCQPIVLYWQIVCWNRSSCIVDINWRSYFSWRLRQSPGDSVVTRTLGFVDSTLRQSRKVSIVWFK